MFAKERGKIGMYLISITDIRNNADETASDVDLIKFFTYISARINTAREYLEKKLKELDPSGEVLRQFFRYWNSTPSGLGSPLRRKVDP